ncbi:hypothetical protein [Paraburkholderia ferrariae]|uniref:Uncharacterized protein n=1 Tax=Paraburkholderia ferrariae TaxID=386056 RepID=A0ABU9RPI9_9BURK
MAKEKWSLFRWIPKQHAATAVEEKLMSHNGSALWVFDLEQSYRPGRAISGNAWLVAYDLDRTAESNIKTRQHIDFESAGFRGEAAHPADVIIKENEKGAYGIGRMRQSTTKFHVTARFATKNEVASALGLDKKEVTDGYRPGRTWPT